MVRGSFNQSVLGRPLRALLLGLCAAGWLIGAQARSAAQEGVRLGELPAEGQQTYALIFKGGPFRYEKDGSVFGNRERQLPRHPRGHYLEYTVKTPGSHDRGARRIVCGGPARAPEACYYTADHYASFRRIVD